MAKKPTKIEKAGNKVTRIGAIVSASIVIITAATGICTWVSNQFQNVVSTQIADLKHEVEANDLRTEQQITRLELANLIHNQPENKAEIEKVARHYFVALDGDWYMTGLYSDWAQAHGGDISLIIEKE